MKIIAASIDLSKIDKSRIIEGKKGGKYYNITITLNDEPDQYEYDVSITEGQTKEERERKDKRKYIGNGKTVFDSGGKKAEAKHDIEEESQDLPF